MQKKGRKKKFLKMPRLGGGKELLKKFFSENLEYPKEALENKIEGDIVISYKVNSKGEVVEPKIEKSLGYGCDEEAIRLVRLLKYQAVTNRGVKVKTKNRMKIPFRLSKQKTKESYQYTYKSGEKSEKPEKSENKNNKSKSYNYTIHY